MKGEAAHGLAFESWGEGRPLLCLHGGMGVDGSYLHAPAIVELAGPERRVVVVDQRGHGASRRDRGEGYTHERWARDVRNLAEELGGRVDLLGHSYGGFVALETAVRSPDVVDRLVLVATSAGPIPTAALSPASDAELRELYRAQWPLYFAGPEKHWDVFERLSFSVEPFADAFVRELPAYDLRDRLASIDAPALLVVGDADPYEGPMRAMADAMPNAELVVLEGAGHFPFLERPDAFRRTVAEFLKPRNRAR